MLALRHNKYKAVMRLVAVAAGLGLIAHSVFYMSDETQQSQNIGRAMALHSSSSFQPRASTYTVLNFIEASAHRASTAGIDFHWDDWVDLSLGNEVLHSHRVQDPSGVCAPPLQRFAAFNPFWMESYHKKVLRGAAFTYCMQPPPQRIFVALDDGFVEVPVARRRRLGINSEVYSQAEVVAKMAAVTPTRSQQQEQSSSSSSAAPFPFHPKRRFTATIEVPKADFEYDPDAEIAALRAQRSQHGALSAADASQLAFLEYANDYVDRAHKYFKYPWIFSDNFRHQSHHLEAKFFRRYISNRERQSVVHHMSRAWFEFAQSQGIVSWINWGSLFGWVYNGVNMPWDTDIDIQIPVAHFAKFALKLNNTLVVENPRHGNAKYLFDVSPTYIRQGNGKNFIDARFIEVNSGLYIDISVLSKTNYSAPSKLFSGLDQAQIASVMPVNCKNFNWHLVEELSPLKYTTFEGGPAYIPNQVSRILDRKYGHESYTTKDRFNHHNFQHDLNMWVPDRICAAPPRMPTEERYVANDRSRLTLQGACNSIELQDDYQIVYEGSQRHLKYENALDRPVEYDIDAMGSLPISRKDPWDYYHDIIRGVVDHDRWFVRQ